MIFENNLLSRKTKIVNLLLNLYLVLTLTALVYYVTILIGSKPLNPIFTPIVVLFAGVIFFLKFFYVKRNFSGTFKVILVLQSVNMILLALLTGLDHAIPIVLLAVMLLSSSIVLGVRQTVVYSVLMTIVFIGIEIYHYQNQMFADTTYNFTLMDLFMLVCLIFLFTAIIVIGYSQIDHSYQQAYDYAEQLEELNKGLDKKVELRTKQLKESFERQLDSVHSAAVMGGITKSVLHDLATPLSSLRGVFALMDRSNLDEDTLEILTSGEEAIEQINRIMQNGRNIMSGKVQKINFSPYKYVSMAVFASKGLIRRENVDIELAIDDKVKIAGYPEVFERIVINLLLNSIDELKQCDWDGRIDIIGKAVGDSFVLQFLDNGRGIKPEDIHKLFDPEYSTKDIHTHLGFGLPFVKYTLEKDFDGEVKVESEMGKFTKFSLIFPLVK